MKNYLNKIYNFQILLNITIQKLKNLLQRKDIKINFVFIVIKNSINNQNQNNYHYIIIVKLKYLTII
jgi:hypothetical protein